MSNTYLSSAFLGRKADSDEVFKSMGITGNEDKDQFERNSKIVSSVHPCFKCGQKITTTTAVKISSDKIFHNECFTCNNCNKSITSNNFLLQEESKTLLCGFCRDLHRSNNTSLVTCKKCGKSVSGNGLQFSGQTYHKECFTCSKCNKTPSSAKIAIDKKTQLIVCEACAKGNTTSTANTNSGGGLDDLEKLADLLQKGIITQDEFNAKKKQILGL